MNRKLRVTIVVALVCGLMVSMGVVEAKKGGGKPIPPPPSDVQVTIDMVGDGLATTCSAPLTMNRESASMLRLDFEPGGQQFEAQLPIEWMRSHPEASGGDTFTGCHGGPVAGSGDGFFGYFILSGDGDGVALSSRFDYYWEYGQQGKRTVQEVLELLEIGTTRTLTRTDDQPFDWSANGIPQTVEGELELRRFEKLADRTGVGWQSFGTVPVEMTITIATSG